MVDLCDVVDLTKKLHEKYSFTNGWLLDSLREKDEIFKKLHGNSGVKDITSYDVSDGKGFVSIVLRCTVFFVDSEETYTTILKIPGADSLVEASDKSDYGDSWLTEDMRQSLTEMHQFECDFYNEIAPLLDAPIPKVYKTEPWILDKFDGCVHMEGNNSRTVEKIFFKGKICIKYKKKYFEKIFFHYSRIIPMEDLTNRGKSLSYFDCINLTQIKSFVNHLAKMHKNILSADQKLWKGKYLKGADCFGKFLSVLEATYEPFLQKCKREKEFRPLLEKCKKISWNTDYYNYAIKQSYIDLGMPSVLVHGDPHSGNILWSLNSNGDIENELSAIIDWQTMHEGSPMEDLARFLTHCTNGVIRRQAEAFIFNYYLECLTKEFGGDVSKVPYTLEQLKTAYNFAFVIQTFFTISDMSFFLEAINEKNEGIKEAFADIGVLKALNNLEDCDRILQGELKEYFFKYCN